MNERYKFLLSIIKKSILTPSVGMKAMSASEWDEFINYLDEAESVAEQDGWDRGQKIGFENGKKAVKDRILEMASEAFICNNDTKAIELRKLAKDL